ncbi:aspartate dehydrogenase [Micromonospora sp. NPDC005161]
MTGVGVIGTGALGHGIASRLAAGAIPGVTLAAVAGRPGSEARLQAFARQWRCQATTRPSDLPAMGARLVVEAAGVEAAREFAPPLLTAGADVILMSTGALASRQFVLDLEHAAVAAGRRVHLPSGSIAGLDGLLAAMEGGDVEVSITTRKHPLALREAPYLAGSDLDLDHLHEAMVIFDGSAQDAIAGFPSNMNVAITLATAAGDLDRVKVRIVADPAATLTVHRVKVKANSGTMTIELVNRPSPTNPRSSWLAGLSALATIRRIASSLHVG